MQSKYKSVFVTLWIFCVSVLLSHSLQAQLNNKEKMESLSKAIDRIIDFEERNASAEAEFAAMPLDVVSVLTKKLKASTHRGTDNDLFILLTTKFKQFESELKDPDLTEAVDILIEKSMYIREHPDNPITKINKIEQNLNYLIEIKNERIKARCEEMRIILRQVIKEYMLANPVEHKIYIDAHPEIFGPFQTTPTPTAEPTTKPHPTPLPVPSPTLKQDSPTTEEQNTIGSWIVAGILVFALLFWFLRRISAH